MTRKEIQNQVRALRPALVPAAERVMRGTFEKAKEERKLALSKTQLSQLIGVCGEASCHEEVANYLRYQAGRGPSKSGWTIELAKAAIAGIEPLLKDKPDEVAVEAWRWYATYLSRTFTYEFEAAR